MEPIAIFDTRPQHVMLASALRNAFERVIGSGAFILGNEVAEFERRCAESFGVDHAIGVSSGSDALYLALRALGIGPGDEVVTTAFSFIASAEAILRCGATPVFADIDPRHYGLCQKSTARMLSPKTRAVLYVHLYGNPGSIAEHARLCEEHGIHLVEDACQAFGARLAEVHAGAWGKIGCFSFFPTKPLGGFGDGGLCVTRDSELSDRLRRLRTHGISASGDCQSVSGNFRLDALQAALLAEKLDSVETFRRSRADIARRYATELHACRRVSTPASPPAHAEPAWSLYTLRVPDGRQDLRRHLEQQAIEVRSYYPAVLSKHPVFVNQCRSDALPEATRASQEVLSIPIYHGLAVDAQTRVIEAIRAWDQLPGSEHA